MTSRPLLQTNLEMFVGVLCPGLKACLCKSKRSGDYHSSTNASMTWPSAEPSSLRCLGGRAVGRPYCFPSLPLVLSLSPSLSFDPSLRPTLAVHTCRLLASPLLFSLSIFFHTYPVLPLTYFLHLPAKDNGDEGGRGLGGREGL